TFKTEKLVSKTAAKAAYQATNTGDAEESQYAMIRKLELDRPTHEALIAYCATKRVRFFSTAFDLDSIDLLVDLGMKLWKIPSGEVTNLPYLRKIAALQQPTILSTGMCTLGEVEAAIRVLLEQGLDRDQITVLHCNTEYPTPMADVNLRAMNTIQEAFGVAVGYSDHTLGIEVPIAAVARGAVCIEKHFTLSRDMEGPDHRASLEPAELRAMVTAIRNVETALGSIHKQPSPSEKKNIVVARKSVHLAHDLPPGHLLVETDFQMMRPGDGISPMEMDRLIGRKLRVGLQAGAKLKTSDLA
ncbi:MAG: N-acetylneuraminate synthase family protein, partial [Bacteroidota bacterium]